MIDTHSLRQPSLRLVCCCIDINIDLIDILGEKKKVFFLVGGRKGVLRANRIDAQQESLRSAPFLDQSLSRGLGVDRRKHGFSL